MAVEFNLELRDRILETIHQAGINILAGYMMDGTLGSKIQVYDGSEEHKQLALEYTNKVTKAFDNFHQDEALVKTIKDTIHDILTSDFHKVRVQTILDISKHESQYLNSTLGERSHDLLEKTGMSKLELTPDERDNLGTFISLVKIKYTQPLKYEDYVNKFKKIIDALNAVARRCKTFGSIDTYNKLNELTNIDTIIEKFG